MTMDDGADDDGDASPDQLGGYTDRSCCIILPMLLTMVTMLTTC
jgi:hypothetical protein